MAATAKPALVKRSARFSTSPRKSPRPWRKTMSGIVQTPIGLLPGPTPPFAGPGPGMQFPGKETPGCGSAISTGMFSGTGLMVAGVQVAGAPGAQEVNAPVSRQVVAPALQSGLLKVVNLVSIT